MIFLKNGEGIRWPHGKRIAVMLTFDFDAELLRQSVIGKRKLAFLIAPAGCTVRMKGWPGVWPC